VLFRSIPAGGTLTLPVYYYPTRNVLFLTYEDTPCVPKIADVDNAGVYQYREVGTEPNVPSNQVTLDFSVKAGEKFDVWIVTSAFGKNLDAQQALVDQAEEYAGAAEGYAANAGNSATAAATSEANAAGSATGAQQSATAAAGSKAAAAQSEVNAAASASTAQTAATNAGAAKTAAAGSAAAAAQSEADAEAHAGDAETSANKILDLEVTANTLSPSAPATADYDPATGVLALGIPKGETGPPANIPIMTAAANGIGRPDGTTLQVDAGGKLSVPSATAATATADGAAGSAVYAKDSDTTSRNKAATPAGVAAQVAGLTPATDAEIMNGAGATSRKGAPALVDVVGAYSKLMRNAGQVPISTFTDRALPSGVYLCQVHEGTEDYPAKPPIAVYTVLHMRMRQDSYAAVQYWFDVGNPRKAYFRWHNWGAVEDAWVLSPVLNFNDLMASLNNGDNGWVKIPSVLPDGTTGSLIAQWGMTSSSGNPKTTIQWNFAFPAAVLSVQATGFNANPSQAYVSRGPATRTYGDFYAFYPDINGQLAMATAGAVHIYWLAIGY
jgi:hypothetical protein